MKKSISEIWPISTDCTLEPIKDKIGKVWLVVESAGKYYLKLKDNYEKAINENHLLSYLNSHGLRVPVPLINKEGSAVSKIDEKYYCLYPHIEGIVIDDRTEIMNSTAVFGSAIAHLHKSLAGFSNENNLKKMSFSSDLNGWIIQKLEKHKDELQYSKLVSTIEEIKDGLHKIDTLPFQPIHRDLHANHFLFNNKKLAGFIDFEISVLGPRIFDLCYFATSVLVDYSTGSIDEENWIPFFKNLVSAYNQSNELTTAEKESIEYMLYMIILIFIAFWCSIKNFEAARLNETVLFWLAEKQRH